MDYDLYHDESKENGYWHGMLLVPIEKREYFLNCLKDIRKATNYPYVISMKGLKRRGRDFNCNRAFIQMGVISLTQYFKNDPCVVHIKNKMKYSPKDERLGTNYKEIFKLDCNEKVIGAKFILFRDKDSHTKMGDSYPDNAAKIETTCRMGLKGGIHWLGDDENTINIKSIHFDGHEHYQRKIDRQRIIGRIKGLREYCSIEENIDDRPSNHNKKGCQDYEDCQFLQLTDLLVGGFRTVLKDEKNKIQGEISLPIKELVEKWHGGHKRMQNSRWYKGFWLSECWIDGESWNFGDFSTIDSKQGVLM